MKLESVDNLNISLSPQHTMNLVLGVPRIPTKVSELINDSGFISSYEETDPIFEASAASGINTSDINAWSEHVVTNKGSAFVNGLYKFTTNSEGHVTSATEVIKADITDLGIPAQDTTYIFDGDYDASLNKAATVSTVTRLIEEAMAEFENGDNLAYGSESS